MVRRAAALLTLLALLVGCRGAPSQILVIVEADPGVRAAAGSLSVEIYGGAREASGVPSSLVHSSVTPMGFSTWPRRYAVAPLDGDADRLWRFVATARRGSEAFVTARLVSGYRRGETLQVVLRLTDACIGVSCESPDETCDPVLRSCRPAFVEEGELDPLAPEGGAMDAGTEMPCVGSADCDDGVACTDDRCLGGLCAHAYVDSECPATECGVALCLASRCSVRADHARCDDAIACTVDRCSADGTCSHEPDDASCTAVSGGTCSATDDCQYPTCDASTCTPQPSMCRGAMCEGAACVRPSTCGGAAPTCCAGSCVALLCDDGNDCTADSCGATGCVHTPRTGSCTDGDPCTGGDLCTGEACVGSACDDLDPCTTDFCDPGVGCDTMPAGDGTPCDDGDGCPGDVCTAGACMPASCMDGSTPECWTDIDCDDVDPCTTDECRGGVCVFPTGGCDAGTDADADADAGDADADTGEADADTGDAGLCDGSVCSTPMEICCGGAQCCDLTFNTCVGTACVPLEAGGAEPCGGCGSSEYCCDIATPATCCDVGAICTAGGCLAVDEGGV
jgi:hypothetical protein